MTHGASEQTLINSLMERVQQLETIVTNVGNIGKGSKKTRFPPKRQEFVLQCMSRAMCIETVDPLKENRVRFYHPLLHHPKTPILALPFARPVSAMGGFDDCGLNWVPPAGSTLHLFFDMGNRELAFYIGTSWFRDRGPGGSKHPFPSREWEAVSKGHRKGYLVGPDDESQVFPPWNTESHNGGDIDSIKEFTDDPEEQKRTTYPNIYGFKTPEKHMLKLVDGNAKCNRRWKRIEMQSGCGNWFIMKDDHLHHGGQWVHPTCVPGGSVDICSEHTSKDPYFTDFHGRPIEKQSLCKPDCSGSSNTSCEAIIGGHPSTPVNPPEKPTKYVNSNQGKNKFYKHRNECRAYKGPGTPQNNKCDLPQSGIQMLSISGHTLVFDDSVEEPRGKPVWERSMEDFDFGCNNKYLGRMYIKSATGHLFTMSDVEEQSNLRGDQNYIQLKTATGNKFEMNDHTIGSGSDTCTPCPPNYAGEKRGIHLQSTSNHVINMVDHMNLQCGPCRKEGGVPTNNATKAYIQIKSGYGLEMRYNDDSSQRETQKQWIQITHPQCAGDPNKAGGDKGCNVERGPHFLRFQGRPRGQAGVIFLRAGGHAIRSTYDMDIVLVGDKEKNPSDKFTYVSRKHIRASEDVDFRYSGKQHVFFAEDKILLLAGRDCPPPPGKRCKGPCMYPVIIARCPVICPLTGITHWTEKAISERVFASGHHPCQSPPDCGGGCDEYFAAMAAAAGPPCDEEETIDLEVGSGSADQTGAQTLKVSATSSAAQNGG